MNATHDTDSRSALLTVLFILIAVLVVAAIGYAGWIAVAYWERVGV